MSYGKWNKGGCFFVTHVKVSTNLSARVRANGKKKASGQDNPQLKIILVE